MLDTRPLGCLSSIFISLSSWKCPAIDTFLIFSFCALSLFFLWILRVRLFDLFGNLFIRVVGKSNWTLGSHLARRTCSGDDGSILDCYLANLASLCDLLLSYFHFSGNFFSLLYIKTGKTIYIWEWSIVKHRKRSRESRGGSNLNRKWVAAVGIVVVVFYDFAEVSKFYLL